MPVKELSLSLLKHAEVANVAKEVCTTLDTVTDANPFIVRLCSEVKEHITKLENRTGQSVKNMLVAPVAEADEERDRIHRGMVQLVRGMQYHPVDNSLAEAGAKIYNVLQSHNLQLSRESYTVESHLIDALIVDIEKPEYAPAVTAINLKSSIDELKASQQRFAQLHIDKSKVNAELREAGICNGYAVHESNEGGGVAKKETHRTSARLHKLIHCHTSLVTCHFFTSSTFPEVKTHPRPRYSR